jgi:hypothetical protein
LGGDFVLQEVWGGHGIIVLMVAARPHTRNENIPFTAPCVPP